MKTEVEEVIYNTGKELLMSNVDIILLLLEKPSGFERIVIPVKLEASRSISSVNLQQKIVIQVSSDKPVVQESKCTLCSCKAFEQPYHLFYNASLSLCLLPFVTVVPPSNTLDSKVEDVPEDSMTENVNPHYEERNKQLVEVSSNAEGEKDEAYDVQRLITYEPQSSWPKDLEVVNHTLQTAPESESVR
jgi:hypothetical protein